MKVAYFLVLISLLATISTQFDVLSVIGFTAKGVASGSLAATVQSGIGLVSKGSIFSNLQSLGALGKGIVAAPAFSTFAIGGGVIIWLICSY